jgi:nicotinamide-nucleotide amidase
VSAVRRRSAVDVVAALLVDSGRSLATAESCTGGLLGAALTSVAGASSWYRGGVIVYDDALKRALTGVSQATLTTHGAVSMEVARELAAGVRSRCDADIGIGITGIAGPAGGTADKPVGLVYLAIDDDGGTLHHELRLTGDREAVRRRAVAVALDRLRRRLLDKA